MLRWKIFSWSLCTNYAILMLWVLFSCALFWTSLEVLNSFAPSSHFLQPKDILFLCLHYISRREHSWAIHWNQTIPVHLFFCVTFYIYIIYKWWRYTLQIVLYISLYRCLSGPILCTNYLVSLKTWTTTVSWSLNSYHNYFQTALGNCLLGEIIRRERSK